MTRHVHGPHVRESDTEPERERQSDIQREECHLLREPSEANMQIDANLCEYLHGSAGSFDDWQLQGLGEGVSEQGSEGERECWLRALV